VKRIAIANTFMMMILAAAFILFGFGAVAAQEEPVAVQPVMEEAESVGAAEAEMQEMKVYSVRPGDDLHLIAADWYHNPRLWTVIYEANKDSVSDPNLIYPGQILYIPKKH
jgi:nucleoid-associated protein YgaU